jgi:hypothetical protein
MIKTKAKLKYLSPNQSCYVAATEVLIVRHAFANALC